ncbi:ras-related protein Rab-28-like [Argiope bruennichi]|uniref:Ras-related protein Rab-28 like protein n=1 Tax=Argiope bruennichi TaxID=94029 RepID=A0A8T0FYM8_ARGBR|nr:ras-related protein Rab-28-like [Argiope bruennichi]XP_055948231.1 ras-related protein Rab-28-like [Argiope bruennichi]KAF8796131.1 Ras-related protein Rab-28 like protein [Argiope bruennichi]
MANDQYSSSEKQFKFLLVGGEAVGKTCIALRFIQEKFDKQYKPTIGVDFFLKRIVLPGSLNVTIQLWDIGSQSLKGEMLDKYFYGADAILFVYDITNNDSLVHLEEWLKAVHEVFKEDCMMPHLALISNKGDLEHSRIVKVDKHLKFALDNAMSSHSVSAKTGESVALCFQKIAGELLGIRLTRSEQETVQPVVKAEIVHNLAAAEPSKPSPSSSTKNSTVCTVQ